MGFLKTYRNSIWRVPLIAVISGFFYTPLYVSVMVRFGVTKSGEINYGVSLFTSAFLFLAVLFLGGITLLRKQTRKEIFVSAAVVFVYGILLLVIQLLTGSITGPAAIVFMYLFKPLDWTGFFTNLSIYLQQELGIATVLIGWGRFLAPFVFVLFGKKQMDERGDDV